MRDRKEPVPAEVSYCYLYQIDMRWYCDITVLLYIYIRYSCLYILYYSVYYFIVDKCQTISIVVCMYAICIWVW